MWQPDDSTAVPKFGDWDERNPSSAEGYTHIFNKVHEEKQKVEGTVPAMVTEPSYPSGPEQYGKDHAKVWGTLFITGHKSPFLSVYWFHKIISSLFLSPRDVAASHGVENEVLCMDD